MIIEQFGVKLKRIQYADIELIRFWRNHPDIRKTMSYRKYISKSMQEEWFNSVNNKFNYYFLIEFNQKDIGVINCKKINLKDKYGEGGIFIWEKELENEYIPVFASLCLLNTVFNILNIFNKSFIQVLNTNTKAISFNKGFGYVLVPGQKNDKNPYYVLTKEDYTERTKLLNQIAYKLTGSKNIKVSGSESSINLPEINNLFTNGNPEYIYEFEL